MRPRPELPPLELGARRRVSLTPPSNASWPTGLVNLMLLMMMAQSPSRLLGNLRANAPTRMPPPPEPPRPPRGRLAPHPSVQLPLGLLVLCSELHLCKLISRASPWRALLPAFPELPGNLLPVYLS